MAYDINAIREQFPSLHTLDDGQPSIYFDNPAGTQIPERVADAVRHCMLEKSANQKGPFRTSQAVDALLRSAREAVADFLNAPDDPVVVFGQSMTALTFQIARSLGFLLEEGDEIVVTEMNHDANIAPWLWMAKEHGLVVKRLSFDPASCTFDLADLESLVGERTRLVCVSGASNLTGTLHDVARMCEIAAAVGAWTYVDGVQSVPHVATDVQAIGCDFLACSAYKFFGPHQGVLWGKRERFEALEAVQIRPALALLPGRFELGTPAFELTAGTLAAIEYFDWIGDSMADEFMARAGHLSGRRQRLHAAMHCLFDYERSLAGRLIEGLTSIPSVRIHGVTGDLSQRVPTVALTSTRRAPREMAEHLAANGVFAWHGHNYAIELVRVLGLAESGGVLRLGPVHYNTLKEVDSVLTLLEHYLA